MLIPTTTSPATISSQTNKRTEGGCICRRADGIFFYAIAKLHLAEAVLLNFTAPLLTPFIALLWLHERVERNVWWAIVVGFVGVALILKPGMDIFSLEALRLMVVAGINGRHRGWWT
ncbi:MAG: DMT family transporter [Gammaproteobacteria bacterium]|nr:DMT family transporter [Gammaproteobacteria bacterium]